jgi:hypothetical protein
LKDSFCLSYFGASKKLHLKTKKDNAAFKEWVNKIQELIEKYKNNKNNYSLNEKINLEKFWRDDVVSNEDFMKQAESGDIILFQYILFFWEELNKKKI